MWRGEVIPPWEWRKGKRLGGAWTTARQENGGRCSIKDNIGKNGTRIYHVPGGRYYDSVSAVPKMYVDGRYEDAVIVPSWGDG